jgi:hypothetical protein
MVYILTWVGGVGCPVLTGHVICVTVVFWGTRTTLCLSARPVLWLGHITHIVCAGVPDSAVLLFGRPTFLWLCGIFASRKLRLSRFMLAFFTLCVGVPLNQPHLTGMM